MSSSGTNWPAVFDRGNGLQPPRCGAMFLQLHPGAHVFHTQPRPLQRIVGRTAPNRTFFLRFLLRGAIDRGAHRFMASGGCPRVGRSAFEILSAVFPPSRSGRGGGD